jgi:RNA-directed DNA polymerase
LHPGKIPVGNCRKKGCGFDFIGLRFESGKRFVRKKSQTKIKDRIRGITARNFRRKLRDVIENLNKTLNGWFNYFKRAELGIFRQLNGFTRRRLRALLLRQNKGKGGRKVEKVS